MSISLSARRTSLGPASAHAGTCKGETLCASVSGASVWGRTVCFAPPAHLPSLQDDMTHTALIVRIASSKQRKWCKFSRVLACCSTCHGLLGVLLSCLPLHLLPVKANLFARHAETSQGRRNQLHLHILARCTDVCAGTPQHERSRLVAGRSKLTESGWRDVLTLPTRAARFAVVDAPFSSKLEVTGVSLMLQSCDARQPGVTLRTATPQNSSRGPTPDRPTQTPPSRVHISTAASSAEPPHACPART